MQRANVADDGPNLFFRERVLEGRHGWDGKLVVADLVAARARILHVARNGIENFLVLEGAHLRLVGQILRLRIRHRRPVEAFVLSAVLAMTMHAVMRVQFLAPFLLLAGTASGDESPCSHEAQQGEHDP